MPGSFGVARYRNPHNPDGVLEERDGEWVQRGILDESERSMPVMPPEVFSAITDAVAAREPKVPPAPPDTRTWEPPSFDTPAPSQAPSRARPAVAAKPPPTARSGAEVDTSGMLARISGVTQEDKPAADSLHPAIRAVLGQAMPQSGGQAPTRPPQEDGEMRAARLMDSLRGVNAKMGSALDPLKAALVGDRDDGSNRRRLMAEVEADSSVGKLGERRAEDAVRAQAATEAAKRDPNSPISQRARQMVSGGDPKIEASLAGMSAAEVEKSAPLLIKRIESEMARADRAAGRKDSQRFREEEAEKNRRNQLNMAHIVAGNGVAREDRAVAREIAKEDRVASNKKQAQSIEIEERYRGADKALEALEKEIEDNGTWDAYGSGPAVREGLINSYATDMAKMRDAESVAREAEVALERKALGEPSQSLFTRNSTALDVIKKQRANLIERRNEAYRVRGLTPPQLPGTPAAPGGAPSAQASASERRVLPDGRVLEKGADGVVRVVQ